VLLNNEGGIDWNLEVELGWLDIFVVVLWELYKLGRIYILVVLLNDDILFKKIISRSP